jgi:peptide/nickel transport system ATP-binding protein
MDRTRPLEPLLTVALSVDYPGRLAVLDDVHFTLARGEIAGLIGASGSGKSTLALAIPRLLELRGGVVHGSIRFDGRDLMMCSRGQLRHIRGKEIGLVLQSPVSALNPALRLETQLREVWRAHSDIRWHDARHAVLELLPRMGLPSGREFVRRYPRQLSVGQAQRVAIAMAVMHRPKLLIADEATSALDPESRAGILDLFEQLNVELGVSILYVSHDMPSVNRLCHSVAALEGGRMTRWETVARGLIEHHAAMDPLVRLRDAVCTTSAAPV